MRKEEKEKQRPPATFWGLEERIDLEFVPKVGGS